MKTLQKTSEIKVQDNVDEAIAWLEKEYPQGVELVCVEYRDCYEDMAQLEKVLKGTDDYNNYCDDGSYENIYEAIKNYCNSEDEAFELSEEVEQAMIDWLREHDISNPTRELLKNTGKHLFYIETKDYAESIENIGEKAFKAQANRLQKKYTKNEAQKKEISYVLGEQYYSAPVSFYFYANVLDVYKAINSHAKYITISGAYFSTIDRVQGSNYLGNEGIFTLSIPRQSFIENIFLDEAKGNGYGWGEIADQCKSSYEEAGILVRNTQIKWSVRLQTDISEAQKREAKLQEHWDKTHTCIAGDKNWDRHSGTKEYSNNYPCGNKCSACGTFWID